MINLMHNNYIAIKIQFTFSVDRRRNSLTKKIDGKTGENQTKLCYLSQLNASGTVFDVYIANGNVIVFTQMLIKFRSNVILVTPFTIYYTFHLPA